MNNEHWETLAQMKSAPQKFVCMTKAVVFNQDGWRWVEKKF